MGRASKGKGREGRVKMGVRGRGEREGGRRSEVEG